jgi:hypothetical protein
MEVSMAFYNGFLKYSRPDRPKILAEARRTYESLRWAKMPFDELADLMLRRHIYYFPEYHDQEDLGRYTQDELKEAAEYGGPKQELSPEDYKMPLSFNPEHIQDVLTEEYKEEMERRKERMEGLERLIVGEDAEVELSDDEDEEEAYENACRDFQDMVIGHFAGCLELSGMKPEAIDAHCVNIDQFINFFLASYKGYTLSTASPGDLEEFMLDFYFRKATSSPASEDHLVSSLIGFYHFLEAAGYIGDGKPFVRRVAQCEDEYKRLLRVSRRES